MSFVTELSERKPQNRGRRLADVASSHDSPLQPPTSVAVLQAHKSVYLYGALIGKNCLCYWI